MAYFGRFPYGMGYGPRWGYNPYLTLPILQSDYKLGGLFNEYNELNDVSARTNFIYSQNMAENYRCSRNSRDIPIPPPQLSVAVRASYYPSYYPLPVFNGYY
jgi:hypothetical protein